MLASLMLEIAPFINTSSAFLSIKRFSGGQAWTLLQTGRPRSARQTFMFSLIVILAINSVVSQFLSTILITDLYQAQIFGVSQPVEAATQVGPPSSLVWLNSMSVDPTMYPLFAEYSQPAQKHDGFDDTGVILRAFLPIGSSDLRESIHNYTGLGSIINTRVVCSQPSIETITANSYPSLNLNGTLTFSLLAASGNSSDGQYYRRQNLASKSHSYAFSCDPLMADYSDNGEEWHIVTCSMEINDQSQGISYPVIPSPWNGTIRTLEPFQPTLLVNLTKVTYSTYHMSPNAPAIVNLQDMSMNSTNDTIWHSYHLSSGSSFSVDLSLSICLATFDAIDTNLTGISSVNNTEPTIFESSVNSSRVWNARSAVEQLGADGVERTPSQRGILTLQYEHSWIPTYNSSTMEPTDGHFYRSSPNLESIEQLGGGILIKSTSSINPRLSSIFQYSLASSGSLATAFQAYQFEAMATLFYVQ